MPARFSALKLVLEAYGISVEKPSSGSHWKCRRGEGRCFPISAHHGLKSEIDDGYIRGACRHFGLEFKEVMCELRGEKGRDMASVAAQATAQVEGESEPENK